MLSFKTLSRFISWEDHTNVCIYCFFDNLIRHCKSGCSFSKMDHSPSHNSSHLSYPIPTPSLLPAVFFLRRGYMGFFTWPCCMFPACLSTAQHPAGYFQSLARGLAKHALSVSSSLLCRCQARCDNASTNRPSCSYMKKKCPDLTTSNKIGYIIQQMSL